MRHTGMAAVLFGLVLAFTPSAARAQDKENDQAEAPKPYVAPGAAKSVEIGNYYLKIKKYNAALSRFREAVQSDPYYPPSYLGLGRVYEKIGLKQKALEAYQKYLDTLPSTKDAEEAKQVHQAITRLERELKARNVGRESRSPLAEAPAHQR